MIAAAFLGWTARDAPDAAAVWPAPAGGQAARALQAVNAYAAGITDRFAVGALTWVRAGITATAGRLFTASWWAGRPQHESALPGGHGDAGASR